MGHRFGPYSQEVMDVTLRVDRDIAGLLDFVDARVGLRNTMVIFTADHGVSPIPEHAAALGLGGARIPFALVLNAIREAISARYNRGRKSPDPTADYILKYDDDGETKDGIINGNLYFDLAALQRDGVNVEEIEDVAGRAALTVPGDCSLFHAIAVTARRSIVNRSNRETGVARVLSWSQRRRDHFAGAVQVLWRLGRPDQPRHTLFLRHSCADDPYGNCFSSRSLYASRRAYRHCPNAGCGLRS